MSEASPEEIVEIDKTLPSTEEQAVMEGTDDE